MVKYLIRSLLSVLANTFFIMGNLVAQDELPKDYKPPYSEPPKLELKFKDDFSKDSRGDYQIGGKKDAVTWEKGKLTLRDGAVLQRKLDAGPWVEMELDLEFPKLSKDGQKSELKIWLDLEGATDSFVWFRQKRESGKTRSAIFIVDSSGEWNQQTKPSPVTKPVTIDGPLTNGKWLIKYRQGLWSVIDVRVGLSLCGYIKNPNAIAKKMIFSTFNMDLLCKSFSIRGDTAVQFFPTKEIANRLSRASKLNAEAVKLYQNRKFSIAIPIASQVLKTRQSLLGGFHADVAHSLNNMAVLHRSVGAYKTAEPFYLGLAD